MLDLALDDRIFLNDPIDCAVQELDIILNTNCTELIGYTDYGTNFEQFLWEMTPSVEEIKKYIKEAKKDLDDGVLEKLQEIEKQIDETPTAVIPIPPSSNDNIAANG